MICNYQVCNVVAIGMSGLMISVEECLVFRPTIPEKKEKKRTMLMYSFLIAIVNRFTIFIPL